MASEFEQPSSEFGRRLGLAASAETGLVTNGSTRSCGTDGSAAPAEPPRPATDFNASAC